MSVQLTWSKTGRSRLIFILAYDWGEVGTPLLCERCYKYQNIYPVFNTLLAQIIQIQGFRRNKPDFATLVFVVIRIHLQQPQAQIFHQDFGANIVYTYGQVNWNYCATQELILLLSCAVKWNVNCLTCNWKPTNVHFVQFTNISCISIILLSKTGMAFGV